MGSGAGRASALAMVCALAASRAVFATDGYFDYGYGVKAKGMGGAGVAFPQDSIATATNPAGMAFVGDRADLGLAWFRPDRDATLGGTTYDGNDTQDFFLPEGGVNYMVTPQLSLGLALFGNGGMNTDYSTPIPAFGTTDAGVDLMQCFVAPTLSWKINQDNAIGISPILAYQSFRAKGLENFGIADEGHDSSYGAGFRVGYTGQWLDWLSFGVTYQSPIWMTRFHNYDNLFAEHGNFDIPANYAVGIAVKPWHTVTLAFDVERILYSQVASISNDLTPQRLGAGLGSDDGPGFGWEDTTVFKAGVAWDVTNYLTLRAGYNYCNQPIPNDQTLFNMLSPAVVEQHITVGLTWKLARQWELSTFYMHAFESTVKGEGNFGGANAELRMHEDSVGLSVGYIF